MSDIWSWTKGYFRLVISELDKDSAATTATAATSNSKVVIRVVTVRAADNSPLRKFWAV